MTDMRRSAWSFQRSYLTEDAPSGPYIISVTPDNGTTAGGTPSVIALANLEVGNPPVGAYFGAVVADDFSFYGDNEYEALSPASATGTGPVDVVVYLQDLSTVTLMDGFTYT